MYFSTCRVSCAFLWVVLLSLFGSDSLNVKRETVFIYIDVSCICSYQISGGGEYVRGAIFPGPPE